MKNTSNRFFTLLFLGAFFVLMLGFMYKKPMSPDEGLWLYMSRLWIRDGLPPYLSAYDTIPPGMTLLYSLSYLLVGETLLILRIASISALMCTGYMVQHIGTKLFCRQSGTIAMAIFCMACTWPCMNNAYTTTPDSFVILFLTFSLYLMLIPYSGIKHQRQAIFIAGVMSGIAFLFLQSALCGIIGILIFDRYFAQSNNSHSENSFIRTSFFLAGLFSIQITVIAVICSGKLTVSEYVNCIYTSLFHPVSMPFYDRISSMLKIWRYTDIILLYPLLAVFFLLFKKMSNAKIPVAGFAVLLFFEFLAVNWTGLYGSFSMKHLLPSLSITLGTAAVFAINHGAQHDTASRWMKWALAAIIIFGIPFFGIAFFLVPDYIKPKESHSQDFGKWIKEHTNPEHVVYIHGRQASILHAYADRQSPVRYISTSSYRKPHFLRELATDLTINRPALLITTDADNTPDWLKRFINHFYTLTHKTKSIEVFTPK